MSTSLAPPPPASQTRPRRMTSPSLPPPSPLNLPEPVYGYRRPPSPLRNGHTVDPATGELSDDGSISQSEESHNGRQWGQRSHSPSPSVAKFAAGIAQRVGSLMSPRSTSTLPTDDELEAEAERERERSRREAERIMMQEAEERRTVEERVLAMLHGTNGGGGSPRSLPPPTRSQTMPAEPPSPVSSQKEGGSWWTAAKNKLTPTKEPLTPAQQIIQETKTREKEMEKGKKKLHKKQKSKEWPSSPEEKFEDPSFIKLGLAAAAASTSGSATPPRRATSETPSSPTPHAPFSTPPSLAASPLRGKDGRGISPSRVPPPLYAQFDSSGVLDMPGTLLTIVKRFEKLEKWTVGHVRALEDRMDDVERWLVEKEREKESLNENGEMENGDTPPEGFMNEIREELAELQGRVGELGREMAKMVTAPGNLSSGPSRNSASIARAPSTTSIAVRSISTHIVTSPNSTPPRVSGSTSPPVTTPVVPSRSSRTRLPYPTGDYATPPETSLLGQGAFSPTSSPPSSITSKTRHLSISGLPSHNTPPMATSPPGLPKDSASPPSLPRPNPLGWRQSSVSPTPRKRYTVALGGPIMKAEREREQEESAASDRGSTHSHSHSRELSTAFFSTSPLSTAAASTDDVSDSESESHLGGDTIGKAAARISGLSAPQFTRSPSTSPTGTPAPVPAPAPAPKRVRPQSMMAPAPAQSIAAPSPVTPLNLRLRSRSTDRFGLGIADAGGAPLGGPAPQRFVDPLVVRRQTKEAQAAPAAPKIMPGKPKVPVGQLVAFFDQEK